MSYLENHSTGEWLVPASSYTDGETEVQRLTRTTQGLSHMVAEPGHDPVS